GAEHAGYCADVTRTWPTGGRYTSPQRDLYEAVLAAQVAGIDAVRPGVTLEEVHATTLRVLVDALVRLGLLTGSVDEAIAKDSYRRFYMHRTSHWLSPDVPAVGRSRLAGAPRPPAPSARFTLEPGLPA